MYEEYYGLREKPFSIVPDPDFLFLSRTHKAAIEILEAELCEQRGFTLLSGEVGSGKTLLVRHLIRLIGDRASVGLVTNTPRHSPSMLEWILLAFGLDFHGKSRADQHDTLMRFLESQRAKKKQTVVIIDEAHNLDVQALEELPTLLHLNTNSTVPVHLLLVGQPEIRETLSNRRGWQIAQLITLHFKLQPLTFRETGSYIRHRIRSVGGAPDIFDAEACAVIYLLSAGLPRLINALCSTSLIYGQGEKRAAIGSDIVVDIARGSATGGFVSIPGLDENFDADEVLRRARKLCQGAGPSEQTEQGDGKRLHRAVGETRTYPGIEKDPGPPSLLPAVVGTAGRDKRSSVTTRLPVLRHGPGLDVVDASENPIGDDADAQGTLRQRNRRLRYMVFGEIALTALTAAAIVAVFAVSGPGGDSPDSVQRASNAGGEQSPPEPGSVAGGATTEADPPTAVQEPVDPTQGKSGPSGKHPGEAAGKDTPRPSSAEAASAPPEVDIVIGPPPSETASAPLSQHGGAEAASPEPKRSADAVPTLAAPAPVSTGTTPSPAGGGVPNGAARDTDPQSELRSSQSSEKEPDATSASASAGSPDPEVVLLSPEAADSNGGSPGSAASRPEPTASAPATRASAPTAAARIEPDAPAQSAEVVLMPRDVDTDTAPDSPSRAAPSGPAVVAAPVPEVDVTLLPPATFDAPARTSDLMAILARPGSGEFVAAFEALFGIWKLDYASLAGAAPCHKAFSGGLSCYEREGTLGTIRRIGLPAVIGLKRPGGDLGYAVVAGMSRSHVKLRIGDEAVLASIGEVSSRLSGPFILLWKSPIQFTGNMDEGSSGEDVRSLRDTLNRIMPEEFRPGEGSDFDFHVTRAVRQFQRMHGLFVDGVVGAETLISINRVLYRGQLPELESL